MSEFDMPGNDLSSFIQEYDVGWTWANADPAVLTDHATGTGLFGFRVYSSVVAGSSFSVNSDASGPSTLRYRVIVTNPETTASASITRLRTELIALSYASPAVIPPVGSSYDSNNTVLDIKYAPLSENNPDVWDVDVQIGVRRFGAGSRPRPPKPTKPTLSDPPWRQGVQVSTKYATEQFVLGVGVHIGSTTPALIKTALDNGTFASQFGSITGGTAGVVTNSYGDPMQSPPPMDLPTATISITRAYQEEPAILAAHLIDAMVEVSSEAISIGKATYKPYMCKLTGSSVVKKMHNRRGEWLPRQEHPLGYSYGELGWTAPKGSEQTDVAINSTKNTIPLNIPTPYWEVSLDITVRTLGWGYMLLDKGYRGKESAGSNTVKEASGFSVRNTYEAFLENGVIIEPGTDVSDKTVVRAYALFKATDKLKTIVDSIFENNGGMDAPPPAP